MMSLQTQVWSAMRMVHPYSLALEGLQVPGTKVSSSASPTPTLEQNTPCQQGNTLSSTFF